MASVIKYFKIFDEINLNIKQNIKYFHVISEKYAYFVTNDNKVYGLGENVGRILGYNYIESSLDSENYILIIELCDQNIQEFYAELQFMFARNEQNQIYSWGLNECGQLARDPLIEGCKYLKPKKIDFFDGKNIINLSCGWSHCLALSSDGLIYGWGDNNNMQIIPDEREKIITPIVIDLKEKIKFILCSEWKSLVVSYSGCAYFWGIVGPGLYSLRNQTAVNYFATQSIPVENVSKICDHYKNHIFIILDKNGKVFTYNPNNPSDGKSEISCKQNFIDVYRHLYYENDHEQNYLWLFKTEDCVYQYNQDTKQFIKTNFENFFVFSSIKSRNYDQTIEISEEYASTKKIHLQEKVGLVLKDQIVLDRLMTALNEESKTLANTLKGNEQKYEKTFLQLDEIGSGSFGKVFKVINKSNDVYYAIKRVEIKDEIDLSEINFISKLNPEFVVLYIDSWIEGINIFNKIQRFLFIQMELCTQSLKDFLILKNKTFEKKFQSFDYFISCELLKQLTECVNYLHELPEPIIHRDLKPANILISDGSNGRFLKLCDFGLAKIHEISVHTRMVGTLPYMAPEVLTSEIYNTKSDVYSLALIATEIFGFQDSIKIIRNHKKREDFDKYLVTNLEDKNKKLLDTLSICLLTEDYRKRINCNQLLKNINEFSIDKNIVLNDSDLSSFQIFLKNKDIIFKNILDYMIEY